MMQDTHVSHAPATVNDPDKNSFGFATNYVLDLVRHAFELKRLSNLLAERAKQLVQRWSGSTIIALKLGMVQVVELIALKVVNSIVSGNLKLDL